LRLESPERRSIANKTLAGHTDVRNEDPIRIFLAPRRKSLRVSHLSRPSLGGQPSFKNSSFYNQNSMEIKIHSEKFKRDHHWASIIPNWIISFKVGDRRLFFRHSIAVDRRGTHYGDTCEHLSLIKNPREYQRLR